MGVVVDEVNAGHARGEVAAGTGALDWHARAQALRALLDPCQLCPHRCGARRLHGERGRCLVGAQPLLASACLHRGEEPVLGGERGVGNLFFGGCTLRCVYCQNHQISQRLRGRRLAGRGPGVLRLDPACGPVEDAWRSSSEALSTAMLELAAQGVACIGLVSPTPHLPFVVEALARARQQGLQQPVVYNSSGYERVEVLRLLRGVVDLYLPDLKVVSPRLGGRLSAAPDYPAHALAAIAEMRAQVGDLSVDDDGLARRGVLVRHLVLPGHVTESLRVLQRLAATCGRGVVVSLLAQYQPMHRARALPALDRRLRRTEYERVCQELAALGLEHGYVQGLDAPAHYLPDFESDHHPFER